MVKWIVCYLWLSTLLQTFKVTSTLQNDRFLFLAIAFQAAKRERGKNPSLPNFTLDFHPHSRTFVSTVRPRSLVLDLLSNNARFFPNLAALYFSHREEILVNTLTSKAITFSGRWGLPLNDTVLSISRYWPSFVGITTSRCFRRWELTFTSWGLLSVPAPLGTNRSFHGFFNF